MNNSRAEDLRVEDARLHEESARLRFLPGPRDICYNEVGPACHKQRIEYADREYRGLMRVTVRGASPIWSFVSYRGTMVDFSHWQKRNLRN